MSIFHRLNHPILNMASRGRRVNTILIIIWIMCIIVLLEITTTNKHLWISNLRYRLRLEGLRPCACNRCAIHDDDSWFTERFNASLNPFLTQDNALSERDFRWWKVNICNKAMLDSHGNKHVNPDSKHSQNPHKIYQYSIANFSYNL
jgi:hypothetical protein